MRKEGAVEVMEPMQHLFRCGRFAESFHRSEISSRDRVVLADINCLANDFPVELGRASLPQPSIWRCAFPYVALERERAVATATTFVTLTISAWHSSTPCRTHVTRATQTLLYAIHCKEHTTGIKRTILHATNAGYANYERLGYREAAQFMCFFHRSSNESRMTQPETKEAQ